LEEYLVDIAFPPQEVEVWAGDDKNKLTMIKKMKIEPADRIRIS
jgi:hypothetical protein